MIWFTFQKAHLYSMGIFIPMVTFFCSFCFVLFCFVLFCFVFLPHSCCPWHENYCVSLEMEAQRWSEVPNVAQLLSGSFRSLDWNSRLLDFRTKAFGSIQQGQETSWTSEAQEMMFLRFWSHHHYFVMPVTPATDPLYSPWFDFAVTYFLRAPV